MKIEVETTSSYRNIYLVRVQFCLVSALHFPEAPVNERGTPLILHIRINSLVTGCLFLLKNLKKSLK